jgi:hypothetical protein
MAARIIRNNDAGQRAESHPPLLLSGTFLIREHFPCGRLGQEKQ